MSHYIENAAKIQKIDLKDFEPTFSNLEELIQLIDINHLSNESIKMFKDCCKNYYNAFAKFVWDIGHCKSTTAHVETITNKPVSQKYYLIPKNVENQVEQILDQLLKHGVIREARINEPSQFVNCLLITRRKNNKIRLLLDSRLVNIHTKTIQSQYTSNFEIVTGIPQNAVAISSIDLSNAYFALAIDDDC